MSNSGNASGNEDLKLEDKEKYSRVYASLEKSDLDGFLVRLPENVLYFSNYWPITGWASVLILRDEEPILIAPDSETIFAKRRIIRNLVEYEPNGSKALIDQLKNIDFASKKLKIGIEKNFEAVAGTHLGYELSIPNPVYFGQLNKELPNWELVDAIPQITQLRSVKSEFDFNNLKLVNEINSIGLKAASEAIREEKTEMEIANICESAINNAIVEYSDRVDFIRAFAFVMGGPENGSRACWPYNISSAYKMKKGELCMIELNTQVNGYWSDITRTWVVGRNPTADQSDMMNTINTAIEAAMKACVPGTPTSDVDKASRDVIMQTKWGKYHTPFLGHGIGVKLHEPIPMLYPGSEGTVETGNYFTIEPGLYGKEILGALRIERDVWLSKDGIKVADEFPCEL